jgi:hypothetical protein
MNHIDQGSFERRLKYPYHVSTATFIAEWQRAPPNVALLMEMDTANFTRSSFCRTAFEYRPFHDHRSSVRLRIYPSKKVLITGCVTDECCHEALERLSTVLGDVQFYPIQCHLININIDLPWTFNSTIYTHLSHHPKVRLVETQEGRPATIVHIALENSIRKVLMYKSGKISIHVPNWKDAERLWDILEPSLVQSKGITKVCES